jgi:thiol oxidase
LNATNFDSVFQDSPAKYAVLEFFAHWCPACRNYKPHYEKVARLFNGADAVYPGVVLMTRVDCAIKMNVKLCDKFSINHYPMLFWAPPKRFVGGSWGPKQEKNEISVVNEWRTADLLLNWINKQIGRYVRTGMSYLPFKLKVMFIEFSNLFLFMLANMKTPVTYSVG